MTAARTLEDHFDTAVDSAVGPGEHRIEGFGKLAARTGNVYGGLAAA